MRDLGKFNYMSELSESSLYANGKVLTKRDTSGSDNNWIGVNKEIYEVEVTDARALKDLGNNYFDQKGFELVPSKVADLNIDFFDNHKVISKYYPDCERIIKDFVKAKYVFAFDHNIRSATGKKSKKMIKGGQQVQGPAHIVHGDYTLTSAPERLKQLAQPPGKNDTLSSTLKNTTSLIDKDLANQVLQNGRFAIINLWRNIAKEPVEVYPLALCDASTVSPKDLVVFEIHYADRVGENYFSKFNTKHDWYFFSKMKNDEALLIKQWDSLGGLSKSKGSKPDCEVKNGPCTFSFHSAFKDPNTREDAPDRWSMEVRCIVIY